LLYNDIRDCSFILFRIYNKLTLVFIIDGNYGIKVVDVSDPSATMLAGKSDPLSAYNVTFSGKYIYAASETSGLNIIDMLPDF